MVRIQVIPNRDVLNIMDYDEISFALSGGELFREFCEKKKVPIQLPYLGGQYWAEAVSKLGHIAIVEDSFSICVYSFYKLDGYQRRKISVMKRDWRRSNFSGVITNEQEVLQKFSQNSLQCPNDMVVERFVESLTPVVVRPAVMKKGVRF